MNILLDRLPESVYIGDAEYEFRTDFRISVVFELLMLSDELSFEEKAETALHLYYTHVPDDKEAAINAIIWFYSGGREEREVKKRRTKQIERIYDFDFDAEYIYAAFLQQYGVDLQDVEHLHWWKFKAMLRSLTDDCEFKKIMGYRAADITKMDKERAVFYSEMKQLYRIPLQKNEQEKQEALIKALQSGGDLTGLL